MTSSPNAALIGKPGSRDALATPCLVLEAQGLRRNIEKAAAFCRDNKIALRPHAKSHKSASIGALQVAAGARGLCVATIGEAEAMAAAGLRDLLVTSCFTQPNKILRAIKLAKDGCGLTIVADDPAMVDAIADAATQAGVTLDTLVDVDLGRHRNGVTSPTQALAVVARIATAPHLRFSGMQAYASHISHVETYADRLRASKDCAGMIAEISAALAGAGHPVTHVTGGSTGTLFMGSRPSLLYRAPMRQLRVQ